MIKFIPSLLLITIASSTYCQKAKVFKVKAGEDIRKVIPIEEMVRYDHFHDGQLFSPSGKSSERLLLNYNILFDEMMYIDKKADTLYFIAKENIFKYIEIGNDKYHHDQKQGYFKILKGNNDIKLITKTFFVAIEKEMLGSNGYSSISLPTVVADRQTADRFIITNENITYTKKSLYYFMDKDTRIMKASRFNLLKLLPHEKVQLQLYVKKENTDFDKQADLLKLFTYIETLQINRSLIQ